MSTSSASNLRLMSDLKTMKQNPPEGVSASPLTEENLYIWGCTIVGPDDTPWEGGIYSLRITYGDQYPDKPPRVRFTSEMVSRPSLQPSQALVLAPALRDRPTSCAVPPEHLPGRDPLPRPDPGQLVSNLHHLLDPHRAPLAPYRP